MKKTSDKKGILILLLIFITTISMTITTKINYKSNSKCYITLQKDNPEDVDVLPQPPEDLEGPDVPQLIPEIPEL